LSHRNIVQLFGTFTSMKGERFIVTEYLSLGSLDQLLQSKGNTITLQDLVSMSSDTARGMEYLSQQKIIHRDLAIRNLLVTVGTETQYLIKVADFGMSRITTNDQNYYRNDSAVFPIKWSAVEVIKFSKFSTQSDVWSFGVVLWEIFSYGQIPYQGMSNLETTEAVKSGYRMAAPKDCPNQIIEMMSSCWNEDPEKRPTFKELNQRIFKILSTNEQISSEKEQKYSQETIYANSNQYNT